MPSTLRVELQLRIVSDDDTVIRDEVILQLDKSGDRLEAIGLCLEDSKDLLGRLQHAVVEAQAAAYVNRYRCCSACGRRLRGKGQYPIVFRTVFGHVPLTSPRFYRCRCHPADSQTVSPLAELFTEHTAPGLLYLESRWASLISFGMTTALLKDVLPVAGTTNPETVRQHLQRSSPGRTPTSARRLPRQSNSDKTHLATAFLILSRYQGRSSMLKSL